MEKINAHLLDELVRYWKIRSHSYGQQHLEELESKTKEKWQKLVCTRFASHNRQIKKVLDVGTGPGFLAILLAESGLNITAIDITIEMLTQAQKNAGDLCKTIDWHLMDAEQLTFSDNYFDAIVTRNLSWNLTNPKKAYEEWHRVLKPGGLLLNFDSNWYRYLYDSKLRERYEQARKATDELLIKDYYKKTDIPWMEALAYRMPLTTELRPEWDKKILTEIGFRKLFYYENLNNTLLNDVQKTNLEFSPLFMIEALKEGE